MQKTGRFLGAFFGAFLCIVLLMGIYSIAEDITLTTYYPAPYGAYNELTTTGNTYLATTSGNVGIGTTVPASKLSVGGVGNSLFTISSYNTELAGRALTAISTGTGSMGVYGDGTFYGLYGNSVNTGVYGIGGSYGMIGAGSIYGVWSFGGSYDFYASGAGTNYGPFTGSHEAILAPDFMKDAKPGMIVSTTGEVKKRKDSLSSTLPTVKLTYTANDNKVFGIFTMIADLPSEHWYKQQAGEQTAIINALGDGRIWVTDYAGEIKNGDRIISSPIPGYGMKEDGRYPINYVVAKITEDIDWSKATETVEYDGTIYKAYLASGIYDTLSMASALDGIYAKNGNVGIGTADPQATLDVYGTVAVSGTPGVSGTFTTADGKTVTVLNGIITSIQ